MDFNPKKHVNYVHLVGILKSYEFFEPRNYTKYALLNINIITEYKNKKHPEMEVQVIVWDRLAEAVLSNNIKENDILHIEGRLTIREKEGKSLTNVTGNRISVVRNIKDGESFLMQLEADSE